jgi:glycerate-2-kinase
MGIRNFNNLATSQTRKQALLIAQSGLAALEPGKLFERHGLHHKVRKELKSAKKVFVVAVGAASFAAVKDLSELLKRQLDGGVVLDFELPDDEPARSNWKLLMVTPHATAKNRAASQELAASLREYSGRADSADNAVVFILGAEAGRILSGDAAIAPDQERDILDALARSAATDQEIEVVMRRISPMRAGGLAAFAYPARVIGLSVNGNSLQKNNSTVYEAQDILKRYQILESVGLDTMSLAESPANDEHFAKVKLLNIEPAKIFAAAAEAEAKNLGYKPQVFSYEPGTGPDILAKQLDHELYKLKSGQCLIAVPTLSHGLPVKPLPDITLKSGLTGLVLNSRRFFSEDPIGHFIEQNARAADTFFYDKPVLTAGDIFIVAAV